MFDACLLKEKKRSKILAAGAAESYTYSINPGVV